MYGKPTRRTLCIFVIAASLATHADARSLASTNEAECIQTSAAYNAIPARLLMAIRLQEAGAIGSWRSNDNGTFDYGVMQINSLWLPMLAADGYTSRALVYDPCASIAAAAWILARSLHEHGAWNTAQPDPASYWRAVGDYHSRTPALNRRYAELVWLRYQQLMHPAPRKVSVEKGEPAGADR